MLLVSRFVVPVATPHSEEIIRLAMFAPPVSRPRASVDCHLPFAGLLSALSSFAPSVRSGGHRGDRQESRARLDDIGSAGDHHRDTLLFIGGRGFKVVTLTCCFCTVIVQ